MCGTREEVGCGGKEDIEMDVCSQTENGMMDLEGLRKSEKYTRKCRKVVQTRNEKKRRR